MAVKRICRADKDGSTILVKVQSKAKMCTVLLILVDVVGVTTYVLNYTNYEIIMKLYQLDLYISSTSTGTHRSYDGSCVCTVYNWRCRIYRFIIRTNF